MSSRSCCIQVGQMLDRSYPRDMATEAIANLTMVERATAEKIQEAFPEYRFNNLSILLQAFTAKTYTRNFKSSVGNNERLEFFGDTILSFIVTNYLFETYYVSEGILTELKKTLCSNKTLCTVGRNLYLDKHIRRSKGENKHGNPTEEQIAAMVEALICAIYLDGSIEDACVFVERHILSRLPSLLKSRETNTEGLDPKSALQKLAQAKCGIIPTYKVLEWGGAPPHTKTVVAVYVGNRMLAKSAGRNKKVASRSAAMVGLRKLKNEG